jgi:hypothetical protein
MTNIFNDDFRRLMELSVRDQVRQLSQQSAGLSALQDQVRRMAEPSSGLLGLQEQMRKFAAPSPSMLALQEQVRKFSEPSSSLQVLQEQLRKWAEPSPAMIAFQEQMKSLTASSGLLAFKEQMRTLAERPTEVLLAYNEQMRKVRELPSHLLAMQEQLHAVAGQASTFRTALSMAGFTGRFPTATAFEPLFAERLVALARAEGELDVVLGTSLAIDAIAAANEIDDASPQPGAFLEFIDRLGAVILRHFDGVRNIADLAHIYQLTNIVLMAVALYYAMHSATSEDIDKLSTSIDQQTATIRQEFHKSSQKFAEKVDALTNTIQSLATNKAATFAPVTVYKVERATPVKAEGKMKSQTVGWLQVGEAVFIVARGKKWMQIAYVDLSTGQTERGWVVKKYLKRL